MAHPRPQLRDRVVAEQAPFDHHPFVATMRLAARIEPGVGPPDIGTLSAIGRECEQPIAGEYRPAEPLSAPAGRGAIGFPHPH